MTKEYKLFFDIRDTVLSELLFEALDPYFYIQQQEQEQEFDLILTDKLDANETITPVIVFINNKDELKDTKAHKLKMPFKFKELYSLINRLIEQSKTNLFGGKVLTIGPITLVYDSGEIQKEDYSESIKLTEKEKEILCYLFANKDEIINKNVLLDEIWGYSEGLETHTLETHIYRLRQKIEKDPAEPKILVTDENGYRLNI